MGCTGAVSKSLLASPYVNFTTVSGGGCFSQSGPVNRVHVCYQCTFNSVSSYSCLRLFLSPSLTLPPTASVCGLSRLGHFGLPGSFAIQGFITLVMITPGCSASCPHASLCPIIDSISTVGLEKEALGLKLLHSVTKGYWPMSM